MDFEDMDITGEITYVFNTDDPNFAKYLEAEFVIYDNDRNLLYGMILDYIYANTDFNLDSSIYCSLTAGADLMDIIEEIVPIAGEEWPFFKSLSLKANWDFDDDGNVCISSFSVVKIIG